MKRLFTVMLFVVTLSIFSVTIVAQSSREAILKEIVAKRTELQELEKQFLAVPVEDRSVYAHFLGQPNTGIVRLLPREVYDTAVDTKSPKTLTIRGGGAYYSFTRLTHEYGYGSDISLDSGYLSVGFAGADYGMLLKIGDVPLEAVSLETPAANFISAYNPPASELEARLEQRRFAAGVAIDQIVYTTRVQMELKTTFLLRSINLDRTDLLVAFRVVRQDTDGSVVLIWKLLKKYPTPVVARNN